MIAALNMLVAADLQANQPEKALARVQAQIGKAPNNPALYVDLSQLQVRAKDFAGAAASAQKALSINKEYEPAVEAYAQAALATGNPDGAIGAWQSWIDAHPADARAVTLQGTIQETKGDVNKAMDLYKKALKLDPTQAVAANNLAYLMVENGENSDVALSYAQTARQALPKAPNTADTLAWVYYHKGTYSLAKDLLEDAAKQDPQNASIHYHLGMTLSKLGDKTAASTELKKASELAPNTQTGKQATDALGHIGA
jgi:tetratricopeptide (TPR) repeat protein